VKVNIFRADSYKILSSYWETLQNGPGDAFTTYNITADSQESTKQIPVITRAIIKV
jgi:hypothetical protein